MPRLPRHGNVRLRLEVSVRAHICCFSSHYKCFPLPLFLLKDTMAVYFAPMVGRPVANPVTLSRRPSLKWPAFTSAFAIQVLAYLIPLLFYRDVYEYWKSHLYW